MLWQGCSLAAPYADRLEGIHWAPSQGDPKGRVAMKEVQEKIVSFFSPEVKAIYGVL